MRLRRFILPGLLLLTLAGPAIAEEIIYFTNGTSMPIRSHKVDGEMIHVDLGSEAFMAFPLRMIEKIAAAGKEIALRPSFSGGTNVISSRVPSPDGNYPVRGSYTGHRGSQDQQTLVLSRDEMDKTDLSPGLQVRRPMQDNEAPNKRALGVTTKNKVGGISGGGGSEGNGVSGTRKVGSRYVIGSDRSRRAPNGKPLPAVPLGRSGSGGKKSGSGN
jgi:hypothetical protein